MNFRQISILAAFCALVWSPASAGTKDDVRDLQARMLVLEQSAAAMSAATVKITELQDQIQDLTGRIEELSYQLDQANLQIDAMSAALAGESDPVAFDPAGGPLDLTTGDIAAGDPIAGVLGGKQDTDGFADSRSDSGITLPLNSDLAYDYSLDFLLAGDYESARSAFELYLEAFPNHSRTADAQFRLGEIHLALEEYALGAESFIDHIKRFPNDARAPDAYVKLGSAFAALEKGTEACTVFKTMRSKFPGADPTLLARAGQEISRLGCGV